MRVPIFFSQLVLAVILVSCGNENQVNTNGFTPQQGAEIFNSVQNTGTLTYLSALIQQTQCPSGQRLPEVRFRTNSYNVIGDRLVANYSPGSHPGQVAANYAGITPQGDILFVQKVTNGMNVLGFNVSVSFCSISNVLRPGRPITDFHTGEGIALYDNQNCTYGSAVGPFTVMLQAFQGYFQTPLESVAVVPSGGSCLGSTW